MFAAVEAARERSLGRRRDGGGWWREEKKGEESDEAAKSCSRESVVGCRFGGVERGGA